MKFCEKCGNKLEDGIKFCPKCGAKIEKKEEKKEEKEETKKEEIKEQKEIVRPVPPQMPIRKQKSGKGKTIFLVILNILLLAAAITFLVLWLTKSSSCGSSGGNGGSSKGKERTAEYLFSQYVKGYTTGNLEAFKDPFPPYYLDYMRITQSELDSHLADAKEEYGDDFTIKYEITSKTKLSSSELEYLNERIASRYNTSKKASECYELDGTITFTGSLFEDPDPISGTYHCNYDGTWYLVG